jgi:hypothetical protein
MQRERAYWVYIEKDRGGWFSEMRGHDSKGLVIPMGAIMANPNYELEKLVPLGVRIPITQ